MSETRKWAVVLGSSSGTGAATCRALASEPGLNIFGAHRGNHPEEAGAVRAAVTAAGSVMHERIGEAGKFEAIQEAAQEVREVCGKGGVQIMVHSIANASVGNLARGERLLHPKQFNKTFEAMAHSFVYWTRALIEVEAMASGGRLLALTNAITDSVLANCSAIAAAKAALEMYVKYLAWELGSLDLRVNALKFGTVETAALKHIFPDGSWQPVERMHDQMFPAGRLANVEDVAKLISVLAGEPGAWFNGAVIDFSGGQMQSLYQLMMDRELGVLPR